MRQCLLLGLYRLTRHYAWWVAIAVLALAILALYSLKDLKLRSSVQELLPRNDPILEKFTQHQEALQEAQVITILLTLRAAPPSPGEGVARLLAAAQQIQQTLLNNEEITLVSYRQEKPDLPSFLNLSNLSEESLRTLAATMQELKREVEGSGQLPELDAVYASISEALEQLISGLAVLNPQALAEALKQLGGQIEELKALNEQVYATLSRLPQDLKQAEGRIDELSQLLSSWQSALLPPPPPSETEYYLSKDQRSLLVQVWPRESAQKSFEYNRRVTELVKMALASLDLPGQGLDWGLKGPYVFSAETNEALRRDMEKTAIITHIGVLLLFILVLKRLFYPLLATLPILVALIFTVTWAMIAFGGLNPLTAFLPAIVLGMGIDYGIQFISHYLEERNQSRRVAPALRATLITKGSAMFVAATATSLVLFGLGVLSRSQGLSEMGFIVAVGVILSCVLTLILLPALIVAVHTVLGRRLRARPPRPWNLSGAVRVLIRHRLVVIGLVLAGTVALAWPASRVQFAFITEALRPTNLSSQRVRAYIEQNFALPQVPDLENYFLFFVDNSEEVVRRICEELDALEAIDQPPTAYYCLFPAPQEMDVIKQRLATLRQLDLVAPLDQGAQRLQALQEQFARREAILAALTRLEESLSSGQENVLRATGDQVLAAELSSLLDSTHAIRARLEELVPARLEDQIQVLRVKLVAVSDQAKSILGVAPTPQQVEQMVYLCDQEPAHALCQKFFTTDATGRKKAIVYAHVRPDWLWNSARYDQFMEEAQAVWSDFIGLPMIQATLKEFMQRDFWWSTGLALLIILIVLRIDFHRFPIPGATWLSLLTLGLGYLWMLGVMGLLRIDFNVVNILISPLIIGLGVDNCVYLLHRHRDFGGSSIERATASTALPILANALATMIGFGSLMLAETSALRILGLSAVMGIGFITLLSLTFLPAVVGALASRSR